jgi:hypothetical protein
MALATKWMLKQRAALARMIEDLNRDDHEWSSQEIGIKRDVVSAIQHIDIELKYRGVEILKPDEKT